MECIKCLAIRAARLLRAMCGEISFSVPCIGTKLSHQAYRDSEPTIDDIPEAYTSYKTTLSRRLKASTATENIISLRTKNLGQLSRQSTIITRSMERKRG